MYIHTHQALQRIGAMADVMAAAEARRRGVRFMLDSIVKPAPLASQADAILKRYDANQDGVLQWAEFEAFGSASDRECLPLIGTCAQRSARTGVLPRQNLASGD